MDSERDAVTVGRVLRVLGLLPFVAVAILLSFVLVFMWTSPDWRPLYSQLTSNEYAIPVTMGAAAVLAVAVAIIAPWLALLGMRRRIDSRVRLEHYATARFCASAVLATGALLFAFVGAFMVQDLVYWAVGALLGLAPVVAAWPTRRRRDRWARSIPVADGA